MKKKAETAATGAKPGPRPVQGKARDRLVQFRATSEDVEEGEELAARYGMTFADWLRARMRSDKAGA
jgi:hypothetical protein